MYICTKYIILLVFGFKNEYYVIWVTFLNLFSTAMLSASSRNSLNKGVKSLLNKSIEVSMLSIISVVSFRRGFVKARHGHWSGIGVVSE
jgi:hypothetical protein